MPKDTVDAFIKLLKDLPSRKEFVESFKNVVERVKSFESKLTSDFQNLVSTINKKADDSFKRLEDRVNKELKGVDGKDGKNGKDGRDGVNGATGPKGDTGPQGAQGISGKDGRDGSPDDAFDTRNKLELLDGEERLKLEAIRGLEDLIKDIKELKARPSGGPGRSLLQLYVNGAKKGAVQYLNITGSGVSYSSASGRNDVTITGGTGSLAVLTATGTVDDSNKTFTFATEPTLVMVNGAAYRNGFGVTIVTTTATLDSAPGVNGDVYGLG